jgi:hypothetical protein
MQTADLIWTVVGFVLTLLVLSLILGDNPLFRLVSYLFVGLASGAVAVIAIYQVIWPKLILPILRGEYLTFIPLILSLLLIAKLFPRLSFLGNFSMAYLVGAGAAVAVGGAVMGTLVAQTNALISPFSLKIAAGTTNLVSQLVEGGFILIGTLAALFYFQFSARVQANQSIQRSQFVETAGKLGQAFIAITFGALLAGVFGSSIAALVERLAFLLTAFRF